MQNLNDPETEYGILNHLENTELTPGKTVTMDFHGQEIELKITSIKDNHGKFIAPHLSKDDPLKLGTLTLNKISKTIAIS